jgi:sorbose reductase
MLFNKIYESFDIRNCYSNITVTGGARGLGYEMMLGLAESGADVACIDLIQENCNEACSKVKDACNVNTSAWSCDVTDDKAVADLFEKIVQQHGKIDILVTSAGINKVCAAIDYTSKDFTNIFQVNVNGTFYCMQQAAK